MLYHWRIKIGRYKTIYCISVFCITSLLAMTGGLCFAQNRGNPNLSEQRIKELLSDSSLFPKREVRYTDSIPAGIKYTEIRTADPVSPPEIIDIAGNFENKKTFKLSDIASSVRYVVLQPPLESKFTAVTGIVSDDEHIFINSREGLFCYSPTGKYLYTVVKNVSEETPYGTAQISGTLFRSNIDLLNGKLVARTFDERNMNLSFYDIATIDAQMRTLLLPQEVKTVGADPQYQRQIRGHPFFMPSILLNSDQSLFASNLILTSLYGDSLCKFTDYDTYSIRPGQGVIPNIRSKIYRYNGHVNLQKALNDTVFRIAPPNRLTPVYIMRWGENKPDIQYYMTLGNLDGKLLLQEWVESLFYIFIYYTEGSNSPNSRREGKVKDHWAIYDKTAKKLTHHRPVTIAIRYITGSSKYREPMPAVIENDVEPVGMPFWPEGINHRGEMYMVFSKSDVKIYLDSGKFANEKLQAIYDKMPDDSFCLMTVK